MPEAEKQEGQKTVVSFITGLLIGGLLVWVFSSSPENGAVTSTKSDDESDVKSTTDASKDTDTKIEAGDDESPVKQTEVKTDGKGSLMVSDQAAGKTVTLSGIEYPTKEGWIVVRDFKNGTLGNILGAARFNTEVGLMPKSVELVRGTVSGGTYQVSFYSQSGDLGFKVANDVPLQGTAAATFNAK